jgi:hypothetical protein
MKTLAYFLFITFFLSKEPFYKFWKKRILFVYCIQLCIIFLLLLILIFFDINLIDVVFCMDVNGEEEPPQENDPGNPGSPPRLPNWRDRDELVAFLASLGITVVSGLLAMYLFKKLILEGHWLQGVSIIKAFRDVGGRQE